MTEPEERRRQDFVPDGERVCEQAESYACISDGAHKDEEGQEAVIAAEILCSSQQSSLHIVRSCKAPDEARGSRGSRCAACARKVMCRCVAEHFAASSVDTDEVILCSFHYAV